MIAEVQKRGGIAGFIDAEHALDPVSYTHLDVYKRQGYLKVTGVYQSKKDGENTGENEEEDTPGKDLFALIQTIKKGAVLPVENLQIKEGETSPPRCV